MQPADFAAKWRDLAPRVTERAAYQEHFRDLCALVGQPTPSSDTTGQDYAFERHVRKVGTDDSGFADVFKRGHFAAEYKRKGASLGKALAQLVLYQHALDNPPLLIVSDLDVIQVHTNFTGTARKTYTLTLADIASNAPIQTDLTALDVLRAAFTDPGRLDPRLVRERLTRDATARIGAIARALTARNVEPTAAAHFLMRVVFCLFAEDAGLLERGLVERLLGAAQKRPDQSQTLFSQLFDAMSTGGYFGASEVLHFNGGLFDGGAALPLTADDLTALVAAARLDWAEVEPSIFGTLFEESLNDSTRSARGVHYTNVTDILRVVEPVVVRPLRAEWEGVKAQAAAAAAKRGGVNAARQMVQDFHQRLAAIRVLDPACGSGNFLYVTLKQLLDLEYEVRLAGEEYGLGAFAMPPRVHPRQLLGIEVEPFAHELASVVLWIGHIQWKRAHGGEWDSPVLERLDGLQHHDALLNADGSAYTWPEADFIVGNPPFLGGKLLRNGLGDAYVDALFAAYSGQVSREADLVCYWFEKARQELRQGVTQRAGLVTTNSIRGGANRQVLERIQDGGAIFNAWSNEPWLQSGAAVRVSIVCFDDGTELDRALDGQPTARINSDLTSDTDVTAALPLRENAGLSFMGTTKGGAFDIPDEVARRWLAQPNPDGQDNADVVRPWVNGMDLTRRPRGMWVVDFALRSEAEASGYLAPFEYVQEKVRPVRLKNKRETYQRLWWLHAEPRPAMRRAFEGLQRYICTPRVAKHRLFVWLPVETVPDSAVIAIARDDDFTFGVLHSRLHEVWALRQGTALGVGDDPRYTPSTCFDTFPFPDDVSAEQVGEVVKWAVFVVRLREALLSASAGATLTGIYNDVELLRATPDATHPVHSLVAAHHKLDAAVAAAYGWSWPLSDDEILAKLLALNLERHAAEAAGGQPAVAAVTP